jgi:hypothetical protein
VGEDEIESLIGEGEMLPTGTDHTGSALPRFYSPRSLDFDAINPRRGPPEGRRIHSHPTPYIEDTLPVQLHPPAHHLKTPFLAGPPEIGRDATGCSAV